MFGMIDFPSMAENREILSYSKSLILSFQGRAHRLLGRARKEALSAPSSAHPLMPPFRASVKGVVF